jgi:hypothetical protein
MKRIIFVLITIALIVTMFSTTAFISTGSEINPIVTFTSLDDFLNAYLIAIEGGDISDYVEKGILVQNMDFTIFETFDLPVRIPEGFIIRELTTCEEFISFWYLPKNVNIAKDTFWEATINNPSINIFVFLTNSENRMNAALWARNQTVDDLIDGKYIYFYTSNTSMTFNWLSDGRFFGLQINLHQQHTEEFKILFGDGDVLDLVRFAETRTVDLTDEEEVRNLIRFGERFQRGDISASGRITTSDALEILRFVAGSPNVIEGDERAMAAADVNGDGKIHTADALRILRIVAGLV